MKKQKFTLMELLVVIAIIAILFSMLMPAFSKTRKKATLGACLGNMKQIGTGSFIALRDRNFIFPPKLVAGQIWVTNWMGKAGTELSIPQSKRPFNSGIVPDAKDGDELKTFQCPEDRGVKSIYETNGTSYAVNNSHFINNTLGAHAVPSVTRFSRIKDPSRMLFSFEKPAYVYSYHQNLRTEWSKIHGKYASFNVVNVDMSARAQIRFHSGVLATTDYAFSNDD